RTEPTRSSGMSGVKHAIHIYDPNRRDPEEVAEIIGVDMHKDRPGLMALIKGVVATYFHEFECSDHNGVSVVASAEADDVTTDAQRYRWLRARDLDAVDEGGVFIGMTSGAGHGGYVLNGIDAD